MPELALQLVRAVAGRLESGALPGHLGVRGVGLRASFASFVQKPALVTSAAVPPQKGLARYLLPPSSTCGITSPLLWVSVAPFALTSIHDHCHRGRLEEGITSVGELFPGEVGPGRPIEEVNGPLLAALRGAVI